MTSKGPGEARSYDGSSLRIGILHSRWNSTIIDSLVSGAQKALLAAGVPPQNITVQSVPGSYELPLAVQRMHAASTTSSSAKLVSAAEDLLSSASATDLTAASVGGVKASGASEQGPGGALDAIIAIGVLIKGKTMHFEYIADAVSHGLMKVQLETACPVVFGLLTCLSEEQALTRAGLGGKGDEKGKEELQYGEQGHNHGEDWGRAAVEMGVKRRAWGEGRFMD